MKLSSSYFKAEHLCIGCFFNNFIARPLIAVLKYLYLSITIFIFYYQYTFYT